MIKLNILFILFFIVTLILSETNFNCTSTFNRSANGDGTNTYYFNCACQASQLNKEVGVKCGVEGNTFKSYCLMDHYRPIDSDFNIQILNCTLGNVIAKIGDHGLFTKVELHLKNCMGFGIAGNSCKGEKKF